jgi:hypothetical protein
VALFVDLSKEHVPAAQDLEARQFDLNGLPIQVGSAPNSDFGLRAGHGLDLGAGFSVDASTSLKRSLAPGAILSTQGGETDLSAAGTARYQQSGWDIQLFPEIGTATLDASRLPNYAFGGSVARQLAGGWSIETRSHMEIRRAESLAESAGDAASGGFAVTQVPVFGARLDLGYAYDWNRAGDEAAAMSHGPSLDLAMDLSAALKCRVGYRYEFAGDPRTGEPGLTWLSEGGQDLTVGWDWDLSAEGIRGTTLNADFGYHQDSFATAAPAVGSGGINFVTAF